jgi:secondary thiamine-phosphate synthase enzyme
MVRFTVQTRARACLEDITTQVREAVRQSGVLSGTCHVYVPHTTAGVTINENADSSVGRDLLDYLDRLVPLHGSYSHSEGNSAAHIKSTIVGCSAFVPIEDGRLALGTWQGIFFCEFDGPRRRSVGVNLLPYSGEA